MVAVPFDSQSTRTRWVNYLVLSLFANALLISFISIDSTKLTISNSPLLKVKLMSFKAPEPIPVKKVIQTQAPSPIKTKKIIAEIKAEKYIPKQNIKPKLKPEPINKITKKIAPPKKIIPIAAKKEISIENKIIKTTKNKENPLRTAPHISNKKAVEGLTAEIKEASYRRQTPPVYPRRALELGQQGNVILHALIKPDGFPSELKVEDSSGHSLLDKAALAAVRKWEFEPVDNNGTTIASWVRVPIEFVIQ